jgi:hypothetical protein
VRAVAPLGAWREHADGRFDVVPAVVSAQDARRILIRVCQHEKKTAAGYASIAGRVGRARSDGGYGG